MDKVGLDRTRKAGEINELNAGGGQRVFDFTGKRRIALIVVAVVFVVGMLSFIFRGFNLDIDFVGGTILEYNLNRTVTTQDVDDIERIVQAIDGVAVSSVVTSGAQGVSIRTQQIDSELREQITAAISAVYDINEEQSRANNVDPTVGRTLTRNTVIAVALALVLMLVYITIRFKFFSGLSTVICLTHDIFVALTFYSLLQIPMNMAVIAAFLTILAYSINTTIIIFDRVRENMRLLKGKPFGEVINISVTQTLSRSINTTVSTLFVLVCVLIIGVPSIQAFVLPIIIGILAGVFSSLFLAGTLWELFDGLKNRKKG